MAKPVGWSRPRAFTLIELVVVIAIIGVLVGLLVVGLRHVSAFSKGASDISKMRSAAQGFALYSQDYREAFPLFTNIGMLTTELTGGLPAQRVSYFDAASTWHVVLARPYFSVPATSDAFFSSRDLANVNSQRPFRTTFLYPCVFIARPDFWRPETRVFGASQLGVTRVGDVTFPSAKALIVRGPTLDGSGPSQSDAVPVVFTDGSGRELNGMERATGYRRGCGFWWDMYGAEHPGDNPPLLHTIGGVQGRDVGTSGE